MRCKMIFYYLREFSVENGFNKLSLIERLILSAVLTKRLNNDDRDYVEIIMNFDGSQDYTTYSKWMNYKDFAEAITDFLNAEKGHMSDYILKNCGNRDLIHYVTIDYSDLAITHKHAMTTIACKAFILSCANHSANDNNDWFSFNLFQWKKTALSQKKRSLEEIDFFMKSHNISYSVDGNKIIIFNKRKQGKIGKKNTSISVKNDEEKSEVVNTPLQDDPGAERALEMDKKAENETSSKKNEYDAILEEENIFNLIESHLNRKMLIEYNETHLDTFTTSIDEKYRKEYLVYINLFSVAMKDKDICAVLDGRYISGEDGLNRKNIALSRIFRTQKKVFLRLNKLYEEDRDCYIEIIKRIRTFKVLTFDTGITE